MLLRRLYYLIIFLVLAIKVEAEGINYIAQDKVFLFDSPAFANVAGSVNKGHLIPVCESNDSFYKICAFGGLPAYYIKNKGGLRSVKENELPRLVRIFAFSGYIDFLYSNSEIPPGFFIDNSSENLKIYFYPIESRLEYIRYEKGWGEGKIKISAMAEKSLVVEVDKYAVCGIEILNVQKTLLRVKFKECGGKKPSLAIDAGHGGDEKGSCYADTCEKDLTLSLAKELNMLLTKKNIGSFLTREEDKTVSLEDRIRIAEEKNASILISLHFDEWPPNLYMRKAPTGSGCYYFHEFLSGVARKLCSGPVIRGLPLSHVTKRSLYMLLSYEFPSVLLEVGNFADQGDAKRMLEPGFIKEAARSLADKLSRLETSSGF